MLSSQIEGTQATLVDLLAFEAESDEAPVDADVFELLPQHPIVTTRRVMDLLETTRPTAIKALRVLKDAAVLRETTGRRRDRTDHSSRYLDRLREGTEL